MTYTCRHCGKPLQERAFWAHNDDTVYLQTQPLPTSYPDGAVGGRTIRVMTPLNHEPEPASSTQQTVEQLQQELAETRALLNAAKSPEIKE